MQLSPHPETDRTPHPENVVAETNIWPTKLASSIAAIQIALVLDWQVLTNIDKRFGDRDNYVPF